ncbi:MAG: diguanylate cyclase [Gammaproteobacteria bacterium]|nr:diguanylate cyclase [Gammaproteobacteria bacterium]MBU1416423.1 diguanylate cyclase [Gammaproteobacteria bacterium]
MGARWKDYKSQSGGAFDQFVEFTLALNSLAERLDRLRLPGLVRQCEGLENAALELFGDPDSHPMAPQTVQALDRQLESLMGAVISARRFDNTVEKRAPDEVVERKPSKWIKPRSIWMISSPGTSWASGLAAQLSYFGFQMRAMPWFAELGDEEPPFAVVFVPNDADTSPDERAMDDIRRVRTACPESQFIYLGVPPTLDSMVELMRAGIDVTIRRDEQMAALLSTVLSLVQTREPVRYRVLVVEDSRVAVAQIQRALTAHGIDSTTISSPSGLFDAIETYQPDLILMDMYMPGCNGVEATRALRQLSDYQALPIVYLSSETDAELQVEALRLGGDQFLTKPFNPLLLAATVKTTIERHQEMQRASRHDGLTGLLNHTAAKAELDARLAMLPPNTPVTVAMIDIDHFKSVNDAFGHPVGDQVIRSLAWLLKGWLRSSDIVGRYGGEEFIVAMPGIDIKDAYAMLDGIRAHFSNLPHVHANGSLRVTFSAGIAPYPLVDNGRDLIEIADQALLEAKALGRNRIVEARI